MGVACSRDRIAARCRSHKKNQVHLKAEMLRKLLLLGCMLLLTLGAGGGSAGEWVAVKRVTDGDTLKLADGRFVR